MDADRDSSAASWFHSELRCASAEGCGFALDGSDWRADKILLDAAVRDFRPRFSCTVRIEDQKMAWTEVWWNDSLR
jgi:hypothetical protein